MLLQLSVGLSFILGGTSPTDSLLTPFEKSSGKNTATYSEIIDYYKKLDAKFSNIQMAECGTTDVGKPLHAVVLSAGRVFDPEKIRRQDKRVVMIVNGIHPGEPDGIDASMMLARDFAMNMRLTQHLSKTVVVIVPVYNVDGCLNRGTWRTNQNGPAKHGFRGNAQNLDLNRDFIKCDAANTRSLVKLIRQWDPDVFIDTHVSDGADYQYTLTYIATQKDKVHPALAAYMQNDMVPRLDKALADAGHEPCPYIETIKDIPDSGFYAFLETPRYSTGYTTLFNTLGFVVETHSLKPFDQRVAATYHFIKECIALVNKDNEVIKNVRRKAAESTLTQNVFALQWKLDSSRYENFLFKGYEAVYKAGKATGLPQVHYDRAKPYEKPVKYFNTYSSKTHVSKPAAYLIPQSHAKVIELLKLNGVKLHRLKNDVTLEAEVYYITHYKTYTRSYEGHYPHYDIQAEKRTGKQNFFAGDYVVMMNQPANRFILETLEPQGNDSYFAWNFFDACLHQKEYFSPYTFEEEAAKILFENDSLRAELEKKKKEDEAFAKSAYQQLDFIYKNSGWYEQTHNRYPVARLLSDPVMLPVAAVVD